MAFRYDIFFRVRLQHSYYADNLCHSLELRPTRECERMLLDYKLLYKPMPDGGLIIGEKKNTGTDAVPVWVPIVPVPAGTIFRFLVVHKDEKFFPVTDGDATVLRNGKLFLFQNTDASPNAVVNGVREVTVHSGTLTNPLRVFSPGSALTIRAAELPVKINLKDKTAAVKATFQVPWQNGQIMQDSFWLAAAGVQLKDNEYFVEHVNGAGAVTSNEKILLLDQAGEEGLLGILRIEYTAGVIAHPESRHDFIVQLAPKSINWIYKVFMEDIVSPPADPQNLQPAQLSITGPVAFAGPVASAGPPRLATFTSAVPIPLSETPVKGIKLKKGTSTLVENLPNPDVTRLENVGGSLKSVMYLTVR